MKTTRVLLIVILVLSLLVSTGYAQTNDDNFNVDEKVESLIKEFFIKYYSAYSDLTQPDLTGMVEYNDDTYAFIKFLEYKIAFYKGFDHKYSDIKVDLTINNYEQKAEKVICNVYMQLEHQYNKDSKGLLSHVGHEFDIELKKIKGNYKITKILRLDHEYKWRVSCIAEVQKHNPKSTYMQAVDEYFDTEIADVPNQKLGWDEWNEEYKKMVRNNVDEFGLSINDDCEINKDDMSTRSVTVGYNSYEAAKYARHFGDIKQNYIFKRMTPDCTNFVSQAIWAGYGGTSGLSYATQIPQLRARVANDYRMINLSGDSKDWWGANYYSSNSHAAGNFMRVVELWNFCTSSHTYGPKAYGYNNNKYYWQLSGTMWYGRVLQFYSTTYNRYRHSVMVVHPSNISYNNANLDNIRVAQHSGDHDYRPLDECIADNGGLGWGNSNVAKMRMLRFISTKFNS